MIMQHKGCIPIIVIIATILVTSAAGSLIASERMRLPEPIPLPSPTPVPTPLPVSGSDSECTSDAGCPSSQYSCQALQSAGTVSPNGGLSTVTIVKGVCKVKEGGQCSMTSDCVAGLVCSGSVCTRPVSQRTCSGPSDTSCPAGYECIQGCGPPVLTQNTPPAPYYCTLKGYRRDCPICLAGSTTIATPDGPVAVKNLTVGMSIWTTDAGGHRVPGTVVHTSTTPGAPTYQMVHLALSDGRELFASPGHPTIDGRTIGDLATGDAYDGAYVKDVQRTPDGESATYDVLPSGETGFYWANGVLLGSTLGHR